MTNRQSRAKQQLTKTQRDWLRHLRACQRSGSRVKDYAAAHGLAVQSLYQAAKRLRARGLLEQSGRRASKSPRFVRVALASASTQPLQSAWRVRLANGTVFESTTPLAGEALLALLERLAHAR